MASYCHYVREINIGALTQFDGWLAMADKWGWSARSYLWPASIEVDPQDHTLYPSSTSRYRLSEVRGIPVVYVEELSRTIVGGQVTLLTKNGNLVIGCDPVLHVCIETDKRGRNWLNGSFRVTPGFVSCHVPHD